MATLQTIEDLADVVTCSICLEEMMKRKPKSLPCQHTFCSQCIDSLLDTVTTDTDSDVKTISCPTCRKPAQIPGGSSSLPSCIYIEKLDKALKVLKKSSSMCKVDDIRSDTEVDREAIKEALTEKENSAKEELAKIDIMQKEFNEKLDMAEDKLNKHFTTSSNQLNEQYEALQLKLEDRRKDFNKNVNYAKEVIENSLNWRNPTTGISNGHLDSSRVNVPAVVEYVEKTKALDFVPGPEKLPLGDLVEIGKQVTIPYEPPQLLDVIQDLARIVDLVYLPNGMLVIGDDEKGLQVYTPCGCPIEHPLSGKCKAEICYISAHKKEYSVAVSCRDGTVRIFTAEGANWHENRFSTCGDGCLLIALTNNCDVILCDRCSMYSRFIVGHGTLCKYSKRGKHKWNKLLPSAAKDICVDNQDRIIICYKDRVTVYDQSVKELFSLQTMDNAVIPLAVCIDLQDDIVLADSNNKSLLLYNSQGKYMRKMIDHDAPLHGLAIYRKDCLAVWLYGTVHLYKL